MLTVFHSYSVSFIEVSRWLSALLLSALHPLGSHATLTLTLRQIHRTKQDCSPSGFGGLGVVVGGRVYLFLPTGYVSCLHSHYPLLFFLRSSLLLALLSSLLVEILCRNSYCDGL
ncbi:hypothetical protein K438DRAFT_1823895 [Mycena galopus ATCC 62051]|nr:hypothetical protein K438DRAFT_1823895 [Mycena galopus ATCC 62051]